MIRVQSFSFKWGKRPDTDHVVDVRSMRNPHNVPALKERDGRDEAVQQYIRESPGFDTILAFATAQVEDGDLLAFGCFGGRHRSVACAEIAADVLRDQGFEVEVEHTALVSA